MSQSLGEEAQKRWGTSMLAIGAAARAESSVAN
jgi:hypothetical protein